MPSRRTFFSLLAGAAVAPRVAFAQGGPSRLALYANVGPVLTHYDVDLVNAELIRRESVTLPAGVQYCWPHRDRRHLYVASSSSASGNVVQTGTEHHLTAFRIDPTTGALNQIGDPMRLPVRPIHMSLDNESRHILVAFNLPSSLRVYRINRDFTPGNEVPQGAMDAGIYAHQVRVTPDDRHVVLVTRGNEGTPQTREDPGALMVFDYNNGVLSNQFKIAPNGGRGYGPRHLDFHPTEPWMYVSIETQNRMHMHRMQGGKPPPDVVFDKTTLLAPGNIRSRQAASTVHVHPGGRFLYGANRSQDVVEFNGKSVYKGGENSIVVYAVNQQTGEPTAIQHVETRKIHPRTFHIDPGGRMLVAQHNLPVDVRDGDSVRTVPAGLSVFRIGTDGKLTFARAYDIDVGDRIMWWMGMVRL
jgi:6-phosphogluconolactonase (cycloisomerase 2 family)